MNKKCKQNILEIRFLYTRYVAMIIKVLGQILSINFVGHFLISGVILFLGIISSVFLTFNFQTQKIKSQIIYRQLSKNFSRSLV